MQFSEAREEIKRMFPDSTYITYQYSLTYDSTGGLSSKAYVCAIPPWSGNAENLKSFSRSAETWQGVIDALKIMLLPKGTTNIEEAIEESAVLQQATNGMGATPVSPAPNQTPLVDKMEG